jgi:hypothetical protein
MENSPNGSSNNSYSVLTFGVNLSRLPRNITLILSSSCLLDIRMPTILPLKMWPSFTQLVYQHQGNSSEGRIFFNVARGWHSRKLDVHVSIHSQCTLIIVNFLVHISLNCTGLIHSQDLYTGIRSLKLLLWLYIENIVLWVWQANNLSAQKSRSRY